MTAVASLAAKSVRDTFKVLSWDVLSLVTYSSDLDPSDYNLCASKDHALVEQRFVSYEDVKSGWMNSSQLVNRWRFLLVWYSEIARKMKKCRKSDGSYLQESTFYHYSLFNMYFKKKIRISYLYTWYCYMYEIFAFP